MNPFEKEVSKQSKELTGQVKEIIERAFDCLKEQVDVLLMEAVEREHYSSLEEKQTTFEVLRNYFWMNHEAYLDPPSKSFKIRLKENHSLSTQSLKDFLDEIMKSH